MHKISDKRWSACIYLALVLSTVAVYWQVWNHDFVNYDDTFYVSRNQNVQSGLTFDSIKWAFTTGHAANWHPLTWLSHMLDWELFGANPGRHHLSSLLLHIINTLLLFAVFRQMTGALWRSAFVAGLFALHPLHVESVAWVSERKDVLSTLFWILTMAAYVWYVKQPCFRRYCLVVVSLVLGLMAKPMLVTLPFVLLLLDYWPLGRIELRNGTVKEAGSSGSLSVGRLIAEKIPLFIAAAASSIITFVVQQKGGAMDYTRDYSFAVRAANAAISYLAYITKMIWPSGLAMFYPHAGDNISISKAALSAALLVVITVLVIRYSGSRRYLPVGWFWYVGTLVPVVGLVQVGSQAMADRYTYVPLTGLFIIAAWVLPELLAKWRHRKYAFCACGLTVLAALSICAHLQQRYWRNSITLCEHALAVTEDNDVAHFSMTELLMKQGRLEEAIRHNSEAVRISPDYIEALNGFGVALHKAGRLDEAAASYRKALELNPRYAAVRGNLGAVLVDKGDFAAAVPHCKRALENLESVMVRRDLAHALTKLGRLREANMEYRKLVQVLPDDLDIRNKLGMVLAKQGKLNEAAIQFTEALRIDPDCAAAHNNLAIGLELQGKFDEAAGHYRQALATSPNAGIHKRLGNMLRRQGKLRQSAEHYRQALKLEPFNPNIHSVLGAISTQQGELDDAVKHFSKAVELDPKSASAHYNLALALKKVGKTEEVIRELNEAVRLKPNKVDPMNSLAWLLATCREAELRDPDKAVQLAKRACELSDYKKASLLDTLAAAYAAAGRFSDAVATAEKALRLAEASAQKGLVGKIQERLALYRTDQAYITP